VVIVDNTVVVLFDVVVEVEELELVEGTEVVTVLLEVDELVLFELEVVLVDCGADEVVEDVPLTGSQYGGAGSTQYCSFEQHHAG